MSEEQIIRTDIQTKSLLSFLLLLFSLLLFLFIIIIFIIILAYTMYRESIVVVNKFYVEFAAEISISRSPDPKNIGLKLRLSICL